MKREPIKWLTQAQVKAAAKKGRKAAIACSQEHWRQLSEARAKEMRQYASALSGEYEALCYLTGDGDSSDPHCEKCPIAVVDYSCPNPEAAFRDAFKAWDLWTCARTNAN